MKPSFASDNTAPAHPRVLEALGRVNTGHVPAYGEDPVTAAAQARLRATFGNGVHPFFVWGGTGANVVGLSAALRPYEAVLCADVAHLQVDECGAPERFTGSKLLLVPSTHGKVAPDAVAARITGVGIQHHVQPRVLSVTQSTEYGTVYAPAELRALADLAHANGLLFHIDGARLANAAASLGVTLRAITFDAGADIVSFGATKNGAMGAETILVRDGELAARLPFLRKQGMQLPSKMRFVAAQVDAMLDGDLWRENASHANAMARRLADGVRDLPGITITRPVEANAVFATVPPARTRALQERFAFYVWNEAADEVRWMASWDTTEAAIDEFIAAIGATA